MTKESLGNNLFENDKEISDLQLCKNWYNFLDKQIKNTGECYLSVTNSTRLRSLFQDLINFFEKREDKEDDKGITW